MKASRRAVDSSHDERDDLHPTELRAFSVERFAARNGISRAKAFLELRSGRLEGRKVGSRTIITEQAERAWQDALPTVIPDGRGPETSRRKRFDFNSAMDMYRRYRKEHGRDPDDPDTKSAPTFNEDVAPMKRMFPGGVPEKTLRAVRKQVWGPRIKRGRPPKFER